MRRLCWLGLGAGKAGGSAGAGAQSEAAAVSVDVPLLMFHYVGVKINRDSHFVNYYYSLCGFIAAREGAAA
jgi:hypothetical protein